MCSRFIIKLQLMHFVGIYTMQCVLDTDTCNIWHYTGLRHVCHSYSPDLNTFLTAMPHFIDFCLLFFYLSALLYSISAKSLKCQKKDILA